MLLTIALATAFLHAGDANAAASRYADRMGPELGASSAVVTSCHRRSKTVFRCLLTYENVRWADETGTLDEAVIVRLGRRVTVRSVLFDQ